MNRFFVEPSVVATSEIMLDGEIAHQISRVLRMEAGGQILLLDGQGFEYPVELTEIRRVGKTEQVHGRILEKRAAKGEPRVQITLYQALLKGEKFDYVLQKCTEIGVTSIVPMLTERCITQSARPDRWRKIIQEAAEQSRRGRVPTLPETPLKLAEVLTQIKENGMLGLMAWEEERGFSLKQLPAGLTHLALLVGPEGGFSEAEAQLAASSGVKTVTLGPRILRAETAGPVVTALALYQLGEME